jgi:hypothetical protein
MAEDCDFADWQKRAQEVLGNLDATESACPVCSCVKHYALPFVTMPWLYPPPQDMFNKTGLFILPLQCSKCGHVRLFGAGLLANVATKLDSEKSNE